EEILLDFREIIGEHSGANLASIVWGTLSAYGLEKRLIAIVADNASNMDTMVEELAKICSTHGIVLHATDARIRCTPHILHLA
ncbi:hypothetical protein AURDEDRAFT_45219, partial [Auricularia subglabra TFB-10046 SS5]